MRSATPFEDDESQDGIPLTTSHPRGRRSSDFAESPINSPLGPDVTIATEKGKVQIQSDYITGDTRITYVDSPAGGTVSSVWRHIRHGAHIAHKNPSTAAYCTTMYF